MLRCAQHDIDDTSTGHTGFDGEDIFGIYNQPSRASSKRLPLSQHEVLIDNIAPRLLIFPAEPGGGERLFLLFDTNAIFFQYRFVDIAVIVVGIAVDVVKRY